MAADIPEQAPIEIIAGDTVKFLKEFDDYPVSESWALTYSWVSNVGAPVDVTATTSGTQYLVTIPAANTANMNAGPWYFQAYVTKAGERYTVDSGSTQVVRNFDPLAAATDLRSHNKKMLDLLEAALEGRATDGIESHSIGGTPISLIPLERLKVLRDQYWSAYQREVKAEKLAKGLGGSRNIYVRFTAP